jgi:ubiquinol-cytochrome c reductase cytochrome c1 subunit
MLKRIAATALAVAGLALAGPAQAAKDVPIPDTDFGFEGVFGTFDRGSLQRGFQVYEQVCASCHGIRLVAFRNLSDLGYGEDEIKAIASNYQVQDGPNDQGDMFMRDAVGSDRFPSPYRNEQEARMINGGAYPPDLSLMAKKRAGGPEYIKALLEGYTDPPSDMELMPGMYYNAYYPGYQIAMPPILMEGIVSYADGTEASVEQMAYDVSTFLMWTAEPMLEDRKQMGIKVILFLLVFTGLMYAVKRKVWADLH